MISSRDDLRIQMISLRDPNLAPIELENGAYQSRARASPQPFSSNNSQSWSVPIAAVFFNRSGVGLQPNAACGRPESVKGGRQGRGLWLASASRSRYIPAAPMICPGG
jgi:hypothetical protein